MKGIYIKTTKHNFLGIIIFWKGYIIPFIFVVKRYAIDYYITFEYQYDRKNNFTDENDYYPANDIYDYHNEPYQGNTDLQEEEDIDCSENKYTNSLDDLEINQYNRNVSDEYEYD